MASSINKYAQNVARARYQTQGGTHSVPVSGRHAPTIDPSLFSGKSAKKPPTGESGSGGLASRIVEGLSSGGKGGGGESLPAQEYDPVTDAESGEDPNAPRGATVETQQPIENRGGSARYMIQGGGPKIDLSFLVPERANKAFDPSKAIGGENLPFQESKGVGGFFRRMLGDESNQQNIAAQQAQGAEWREAAKEQKAEDRILNRMREADKPTQARFEATQTSNKESEANRVAAENKRIALEGERVGLTKQQIQDAKDAHTAALQLQRQQMLDRVTQNQAENDLQSNALAQRLSISNHPQMISLRDGGMGVMNPADGSISIVNPGTAGFGNTPGTPSTTKQVYPQVKAPVNPNPGGGGQVNRGTGATMGGPLVAPTRSGISLDGALGESTELPAGGGVRMGGPLPAPPQNTALIPRFMQGAGDVMGGAMTYATDPLRYAGKEMYKQLLSSGAQQDPEVLKRLKKREEESSPWDIQ